VSWWDLFLSVVVGSILSLVVVVAGDTVGLTL